MTLVISAVNFTEGGPLTILRQAAQAAAEHFPDWTIYALVHKVGTVNCDRVIELAFPQSKRSWLSRLYLEWFEFRRLSAEVGVDVWLSLHDITPRVRARRQYVYCHNPSPFALGSYPGERFDPGFTLFRRYYGFLYRCFIHRNAAVVVQQQWLRLLFERRFGVRRVIVSHPDASLVPSTTATPTTRRSTGMVRFIYPAFPRVFKNFELLGECASILQQNPAWTGRILLTIDGSENAYARDVRQRYGHLHILEFLGLQSPARLQQIYNECDALLFPSLLETWGLPLTEAKELGLPILAADLPYARETVGTYDRVGFFDPKDARALAGLLLELNTATRDLGSVVGRPPHAPFADGWPALLKIMLVDDEPPPGTARLRPPVRGSRASGDWRENPSNT